jgi:hypothetical protein
MKKLTILSFLINAIITDIFSETLGFGSKTSELFYF